MRKFLLFALLALLGVATSYAQVTTSSISGIVRDEKGPVPGVTVTALHTPTGTKYSASTRADGRFNLPNVNVGGPFTISAYFIGYQKQVKEGIMTTLGEDKKVDFSLVSSNTELEQVIVTGSRNGVFDRSRVSTTTVLDSAQIASIPTVNRNISDYIRLSPQARIDYNGGISIGGQNNRYNSITVNGASANDAFGLAASGTNGGQAQSSPIPVDAIDQYQINVAPFDIRYSGFTGGAVNAVTKSGTNEFKGGFSYSFRNQNIAGKTPTDIADFDRKKLDDFTSKYYSLNGGGPIIKDKLFFYVTGELQKNENPAPFIYSDYKGNAGQDGIPNLINYLKTTYNYDPGTYLNNESTVDRKAVTAKLDWNINTSHRLTLFGNYIDSKYESVRGSNNTNINFSNNGILYPNKTYQFTADLKSSFANNLSNDLLVGYTATRDNRNYMGNPFPGVRINDGSGTIYFGAEDYSTANQLNQDVFTLINETKLYQGKHTFSLIEDLEFNKYYNLFIRQSFGKYTYDSIDDFINNAGPRNYEYSYSIVDNINGDGSKAGADFKTYRLGLAIQDKIELNDRLTVVAGLRADYAGFPTKSAEDTFFNNTAAPIIEQYYDLNGARSSQMPKGYISLSPRVAFNYALNEERSTQIRGGAGLFQGRLPGVWPGGVYSNSGVIISQVPNLSQSAGNHIIVDGKPLQFSADPNNQYKAEYFTGKAASVPAGELDVVGRNFKLPKVAKFSLAVDQKLPWGITGTFEGQYTRNINQVMYYNVNLVPPTVQTDGPGSRTTYSVKGKAPVIDFDPSTTAVDNPYGGNVYLLTNGGPKGYTYSFSALLSKNFANGLSLSASYLYSRAKVVNDVTSSQNSSQWRYMESVNGKNNLPLSNSDFDFGHNIKTFVSYTGNWFKFGGTTIGLSYYGQSGSRFSYVYRNSIINDYGSTESSDLIFIPNNASDLKFTELTVGSGSSAVKYSPEDQAAAFEKYISGDPYLSKNRGKFAERNGSRLPFTNIVDLHLEQRFFVQTGKKKQNLSVSFDVNNFTNLLNKKWGRVYYVANDYYTLLTFSKFNDPNNKDYTPVYQFNPNIKNPKDAYSIQDDPKYQYNNSRWIGQVTLKYFFQ